MLALVLAEIVPEPPDSERAAILAALATPACQQPGGWEQAALAEAVETGELDP